MNIEWLIYVIPKDEKFFDRLNNYYLIIEGPLVTYLPYFLDYITPLIVRCTLPLLVYFQDKRCSEIYSKTHPSLITNKFWDNKCAYFNMNSHNTTVYWQTQITRNVTLQVTHLSVFFLIFFPAFVCPFSSSKPSDFPKSLLMSGQSTLQISHMI